MVSYHTGGSKAADWGDLGGVAWHSNGRKAANWGYLGGVAWHSNGRKAAEWGYLGGVAWLSDGTRTINNNTEIYLSSGISIFCGIDGIKIFAVGTCVVNSIPTNEEPINPEDMSDGDRREIRAKDEHHSMKIQVYEKKILDRRVNVVFQNYSNLIKEINMSSNSDINMEYCIEGVNGNSLYKIMCHGEEILLNHLYTYEDASKKILQIQELFASRTDVCKLWLNTEHKNEKSIFDIADDLMSHRPSTRDIELDQIQKEKIAERRQFIKQFTGINLFNLSENEIINAAIEFGLNIENDWKIERIERELWLQAVDIKYKKEKEEERRNRVEHDGKKKKDEENYLNKEVEYFLSEESTKHQKIIFLNNSGQSIELAKSDFRGSYTWEQVDEIINKVIDGWRLPTADEIELMHKELHLKGKGNFQLSDYWGRDEGVFGSGWRLNFKDGSYGPSSPMDQFSFSILNSLKKGINSNEAYRAAQKLNPTTHYLRLVRNVRKLNPIEIKGDETTFFCLEDSINRKEFCVAKRDFEEEMTWEQAKKACVELGDGWRLPNIHELELIHKRLFGTINVNLKIDRYWSVESEFEFNAWGYSFVEGSIGRYLYDKEGNLCVRAVKSMGSFEDKYKENDKIISEKSRCDLILRSSGANKLIVIKIVHKLTGIGLKESKELVDDAPAILFNDISKDNAQQFQKTLEEAGADVELKIK